VRSEGVGRKASVEGLNGNSWRSVLMAAVFFGGERSQLGAKAYTWLFGSRPGNYQRLNRFAWRLL
jgi:hypothetical protein